ncbi:zinc metalloproteinase nas-15-like isoform X2 [Artemia franciscana]|uniref:zinc metalloproteinase nas-15-like isoform X2 n=1 Tax=Artemia franciscana TaxID=6661 RepID=UPI0032D9C0EC
MQVINILDRNVMFFLVVQLLFVVCSVASSGGTLKPINTYGRVKRFSFQELHMPGEPINPDDFLRAEQLDFEVPVRDSLNSDPIEMAGLFEGDIAGVDKNDLQKSLMKNAIRDTRLRWEGGKIPYVISSSFTQYERSVIARAFREYQNKTCIRFVPRRNERDYINIYQGSGCSSMVGRTKGSQPVSLGNGCLYVGIVIHELMHAAGFWHEQSRADRDKYITIIWNNIQSGMDYNFRKYSLDKIQYLDENYDTGSIMHYDAYAFARDRSKPTIVPKKDTEKLGQRNGFSKIDLLKLNKLYKCSDFTGVTEKPKPKPTTTTAAPEVTTELPGECIDTNKYCSYWASAGECDKNSAWMSVNCRKSCNECDKECTDVNVYCERWAQRGECSRNPAYMDIYCPKSCEACKNKGGPGNEACEDNNRYCTAWAERGQCDVNPEYMLSYCSKACKAC